MNENIIIETISLELPIDVSSAKLKQLSGKTVLIKCGGNAMIDEQVKQDIVADVVALKKANITPVIVHGGGPAIQKLLNEVGVESEFVDGHRKTDAETMGYVEMALSGSVNSELVSLISDAGIKAVGISGKDGDIATARKRTHQVTIDGQQQEVDLGHVGDIDSIDTSLVKLLIENDYIPVISPVAGGKDLDAYNVNADMFAGHMAGALGAERYVALTNVDGLQLDPHDPSTLIEKVSVQEARSEIGNRIQGGMIPKVESCIIALEEGVDSAHIINGMKAHNILRALLTDDSVGTTITRDKE